LTAVTNATPEFYMQISSSHSVRYPYHMTVTQ